MRAQAYVLTKPGTPLAQESIELGDLTPGQVVVEVLACGLCHTDLGFADGSVAPKHALPLVLGHEVVGKVIDAAAGAESLLGRNVIVPSVMACGECAYCRAGRSNICPKQIMPGNDVNGGFSTHMIAPGRALVTLDDLPASVRLDSLSVVADAVSTAYQAIRRSGLQRGDLAFVVGAGGVGGFVAQIAHALGAYVVVCDVSDERLAMARTLGADHAVNVGAREQREVRKELQGVAKEQRIASLGWRIFECSGTTPGQTLAYSLIGAASTLVVTGFTREPASLRLSNLMAFDATVHGTWGAPGDSYPGVLELIAKGAVQIEPVIERAPMSRLPELMGALARHELGKRMVLDPKS